MKTIKQANATTIVLRANAIKKPNVPLANKKTWLDKDITLNVGFEQSMKRCIIALLAPIPLLFAPIPLVVNHTLLVAAIPVMFYFFFTGLIHFCPIKYIWQHGVRQIPDPEICDFAIDLNVPVETI